MKRILLLMICNFLIVQYVDCQTDTNSIAKDSVKVRSSRLTIGGYGEAVYKYNFYSDNMFRYSHAENYASSKGHGRVDLPHAVFMLGYDFGKGWSFN
ncbi:MAG: autotransporter outer membrane beta-barrel domain-containing protein, partial [Bacteroidales bacterium]|nr:autotransporter outer membrane beta-barrel domain-containing protein [Bacteroidales bacterium]